MFKIDEDAPWNIYEKPYRNSFMGLIVALDGTGDYDTIKDAIKNLPSNGGTIFIKDGTYAETSIEITKNNVRIEGISPGTPTISLGNNNGILINEKNKIIIKNLRFTGGDVVGKYAIRLNNSYDCIVENCYLGQMDSLELTGGSFKNTIKNNIFYQGNYLLKISGSNLNIIEGNHMDANLTETGIYLINGSNENIIIGNIINNCMFPIWILSGQNNVISSNKLTNDDSEMYDTAIKNNGDRTIIIGNNIKGIGFWTPISNTGTNTQIGHNIET